MLLVFVHYALRRRYRLAQRIVSLLDVFSPRYLAITLIPVCHRCEQSPQCEHSLHANSRVLLRKPFQSTLIGARSAAPPIVGR